MRPLVCYFLIFFFLVWHTISYAGEVGNISKMDEVYLDVSRCLGAPEIRGEKDNPISCFCRDAIMDARYVYQNYVHTGKDLNLKGIYLTLVGRAQQICGEKYDVWGATSAGAWQWNGPQVTREYPPEKEILKIKADSKGFRSVKYDVRVTYYDSAGKVVKVENFKAIEKLPGWTKQ